MTIPASVYVQINPGVVNGGGNSLAMNAVFLTQNSLTPSGQVLGYVSQAAVGAVYGLSSAEYAAAGDYYLGYQNKTLTPGLLYFAPYHAADVAAWVRGGSLASVSLTELQAISGTLIVDIDGVTLTAASLNLSAASSFTNAATLIATALGLSGGQTCTWNAQLAEFQITSGTTGASSTITACTGTTAAALKLSSTSGITLSQGADADTPTTAMENVVSNTLNWASFTTIFEPDTATKVLFAAWNNDQNLRYHYAMWDSDESASTPNATATAGAQCVAAEYEGVSPIGGDPLAVPDGSTLAALVASAAYFLCGAVASVNFTQTNGRVAFKYRTQSGMLPTCKSEQSRANLLGNGYNMVSLASTANQNFTFYDDGHVTGTWDWLDSYTNQIYFNAAFQLGLLNFLTQIGSVPYNQSGYAQIALVMQTTIQQMLNFGAARVGVTVSDAQAAVINAAAGKDITTMLETQGYYLQILDPGSIVRAARGSPVINFWYMDGQSVQQITLASINVQ